MVEDFDPHIIGITESWAITDISDPKLRAEEQAAFPLIRFG